jgi:electron transfer flavoprotein alpha subunit
MAVLLLAEVNGAELAVDATAKAVSAAKSLGDVTVLCASAGCGSAAEAAAKLDGVAKVLCADDVAYGNGLGRTFSGFDRFIGRRLRTYRSTCNKLC